MRKVKSFIIFILLISIDLVYAEVKKFKYDPKGRRDPFIPLVTDAGQLLELEPAEEGISGLHLEGIIFDKKELSYAIINSTVVRIGDWVGEYQVYKIEPKKVILLKEGEKFELELKEE